VSALLHPAGVVRELAQLYVDLRMGIVEPKVANTGVYTLQHLLRGHETVTLAERLLAIEESLRTRGLTDA
jgi:hypothetical protein